MNKKKVALHYAAISRETDRLFPGFFQFFFPIYAFWGRNSGKSVTFFYGRIFAFPLLSTKRQRVKCYTLPVQPERWRRKPIMGPVCPGKEGGLC